jgi:hypothetical protein
MNKKAEIRMLLADLGGELEFEYKDEIVIKTTPHTPAIYIRRLSVDDEFSDNELVLNSILQRLRWLTYKKKNNGSV